MNPRPDISDELIHFSKGENFNDAFARLRQIIAEGRILGSGVRIRGGYECVCFTEAPLQSLQHGLVNPTAYSRYSPFGIIVEKRWLFEKGARPVIYQPDYEFEPLPEALRWRHMTYEPGKIDFTWEREWRIRTPTLQFAPNEAGIIVPSQDWADALLADHVAEQDWVVYEYTQIMDGRLAEQYRERFPWRIYVLR